MGGEKVHTLAYVNDVVLLAKKEGGMRSTMEKLKGFLERKELELNAGKSKIIRCRRGEGRFKKIG